MTDDFLERLVRYPFSEIEMMVDRRSSFVSAKVVRRLGCFLDSEHLDIITDTVTIEMHGIF